VNAISDPGRPSRRDRRRAQKLIDTAFAEGRLTAADRALRTQRIEAAHTRGDLTMITRDIVAPVQADLGRALDPSTMSSMRAASTRRTPGTPGSVQPSSPTVDLSGIGRKVRLIVLIGFGGIFASCVLGIVAFIVVGVTQSGRDLDVPDPGGSSTVGPSSRPTPSLTAKGDSASLHTAAGWTSLVEAIKSKSGTTEVYDLVAYPQYASVGLDGEGAVERRFYRDGAWQDSVSVRTPTTGSLIDLAEIDAELIARLPAETARHFSIADPTGTYIIVNAFSGAPQIAVYVQSDGESRYRAYRLDGTAIS